MIITLPPKLPEVGSNDNTPAVYEKYKSPSANPSPATLTEIGRSYPTPEAVGTYKKCASG